MCWRLQPAGREIARTAATPPPSITFSVTVKTGISMKCWCTMPIPDVDGVTWIMDVDGGAADDDLTLILGCIARRGCSSTWSFQRRSPPAARGFHPD